MPLANTQIKLLKIVPGLPYNPGEQPFVTAPLGFALVDAGYAAWVGSTPTRPQAQLPSTIVYGLGIDHRNIGALLEAGGIAAADYTVFTADAALVPAG